MSPVKGTAAASPRLVWRDAHELEPRLHPVPSVLRTTDASRPRGAWRATVAGHTLQVAERGYGLRDVSDPWFLFLRRPGQEHFTPACLGAARPEQVMAMAEEALSSVRGPEDVEDALRHFQVWERVREAIAAAGDLGAWGADAATHAPEALTPEALFVTGLRVFLRELERRGFVVGPGGSIVESWKARATGHWIPYPDVFPAACFEGPAWIRLEGGRTLVVTDESEDRPAWRVTCDGRDLGVTRTVEAAMARAIRAAGVRGARKGRSAR